MSTLNLRIRYRPIRIGFCLELGDFNSLRAALRLTHTLWGGRYNPIITINDHEYADTLVEAFKVDALYPLSAAAEIKNFIDKYTYLPWPIIHKDFFIEGSHGKLANFLDLYHPIRKIYNEHVKNVGSPSVKISAFDWDDSDPLAAVFLATFGELKNSGTFGIDYQTLLYKHLPIEKIKLEVAAALPSHAFDATTVNTITAYNLAPDRLSGWMDPGFYLGDASAFEDIVNYWNLRACALDIFFFDRTQETRLNELRTEYIKLLEKRPERHPGWPNRIAIWMRERDENVQLDGFGSSPSVAIVDPIVWNRLNLVPPLMGFDEKSVLASLDGGRSLPSVTFQLPEKPFFPDPEFHTQHAVVTVSPLVDIHPNDGGTFQIPSIPELNEYFGREVYFKWDCARAEQNGIGIIINITHDSLSLNSLQPRDLIHKVFEVSGIQAKPSMPGLITARIVRQIGGLQGCRVFKLTGVRRLFEEYTHLQSFTRRVAIQMIGPSFQKFERLFIEYREKGKLSPEDALSYLLRKGVFRVGLEFRCPHCKLDFWRHIDEVKTLIECEYCGNSFDVTSQLRDRDWRFRRTGLFGRDDHQQGAVAVMLTLQQLDTVIGMRTPVFTFGTNVAAESSKIKTCEVDFVLMTPSYRDKWDLAIGECKTRQAITREDVDNLRSVADALPSKRLNVYIVFAKLSPFTSEEIELCKSAQDKYRWRVIMFSDRELEPYHPYDWASEEFEVDRTVISLEDLAKATHQLYFDPKPKKAPDKER